MILLPLMLDSRRRRRELEDMQKGMKKKVKVINMLDSVEKKEVVLEKIEETIEELYRYKRDALQKTWEKVNGAIAWQLCEIAAS